MKLKAALFSIFVLCAHLLFSQTTGWTFNNGTQGWGLMHSLTGYTAGGKYHLAVTGAQPYICSPGGLNIDATAWGQLHVSLQNGTPAKQFRIFWITSSDTIWSQTKSQAYTVTPLDSKTRDYTIILLGNINWTGTIMQIRLDIGDKARAGDSVVLRQVKFKAYEMGLDNGTVHVRLDVSQGGAISYISASGSTRSIINTHDEGRYVQQSYYSGNRVDRRAQGESPAWSPWPWNPIQVGDAYLHHAQITGYDMGDTLYTKCIPMLWDMDSMPAQATMEQWTTLDSNVITVRNRLTCFRTDTIYGNATAGQELPAVYIVSTLRNLYSYFGAQPFTNAPVQRVPVVNLASGFWGTYDTTSEHWMAFVDDTLWGLGVFNRRCTLFYAGIAGAAGAEDTSYSTNYIAPSHRDSLPSKCVYEYSYNLILGTLPKIRATVYRLNAAADATGNTEKGLKPNNKRQRIKQDREL